MSDNHDCAFEYRGQRCRNPGSISEGTSGGGTWYCRVHIRVRTGKAALREVELSQIGSAEAPATDKLEWLDKNFPRNAGETDHGYAMRCKALALTGLQAFRLKPIP